MSTVLWPTQAWAESLPELQKMDSGKLVEADSYIKENRPNVYSLLLVRNGYRVFERYYQGCDPESLHRIASATKSVLSIVVGIALRKGYLRSADQSIAEFFPELESTLKSSVKDFLTIRRLLTMKEGLLFSEDYEEWDKRRNNPQFTLDLPPLGDPDENLRFSGAPRVVSRIINVATGMNAAEFAETYLFRPLGIQEYQWPIDSTGTAWGSGGLRLTARDMAKLGYLYLQKGTWENREIVS
ncbi:MAG: beta-lactamase family protein, partial [Armatimonadetes bacterium]|nr:beta-lactamase family protein [Armatimonadota bacterium]